VSITTEPAVTETEREAELTRLGAGADWHTYAAVTAALAKWSHPSLSPGRRADLFESYREHTERAAALRAGVAHWSEYFDAGDFYPPAGDIHDVAAELLEDRAREEMYILTHGDGEK
jgi:hypothetical protein